MNIPWLAAAISLAVTYCPSGAVAAGNGANAAVANAFMASIPVSTASAPVPGRPTDAASARAAVLAGNYTRSRYQVRDGCPLGCSSVGVDTSAWYVYGSLDRLITACHETMLLDFGLFNQVDKPRNAISACVADLELAEGGVDTSAACVADGVQRTEVSSSLQLVTSGASSADAADAAATALLQLQASTVLTGTSCNETIRYASSGSAVVGVYAGSGLAGQGVVTSVLERFGAYVTGEAGIAETFAVQICGGSSARYSLGIMVSTTGDFGVVQRGLQSWKNGSCVALDVATADWDEVTYLAPTLLQGNATFKNSSASYNRRRDGSDECSTIQVEEGDTCTTLASECGITGAEFTEYNSDSSLCSGLIAGQHVCCSEGTLPDYAPQPGDDGYCYSYTVQSDDTCSAIAAAYDITVEDIENYNTDTWAWNGCSSLYPGYYICLSSGYPPMPATRANAVCGPQVNGTAKVPPGTGTDLSTLNECPLNACCDTWGQCGTTDEFCTESNSTTGAPGTAAANENGCISNCGTSIITSDKPSDTYTIAYFEGFDWSRPCLRNSVSNLNTSAYTHIHFSFVTLNADFSINITDIEDQLPSLQGLINIKKIVSIGGWTFSTDPDTYTIFRDAVASEDNRQTLITKVLNFLNEYNLDGVDWDWEYPSEPDIPGIPAGDESEATDYFLFLDELKEQMPDGKTVSVTAPASYWYLQYFPIDAISLVVDYLVFMTYDLHGQWDYSNKYATDGCPSADSGLGNCLRSHVNLTETINTMSMITKAGVPSNKVALGVSSYGRSFEMTTAGCWTEQCTYTGPESGAYPGPCTNTAGYIANYEIDLILDENESAQTYWDEASYSSIIVFNDTQWVAYMNDSNKAFRKTIYEGFTFLGTADWAVDLQSEDSESNDDDDSDSTSLNPTYYIDPAIWNSATQLVSAVPGATLVWPPMPLSSTTTITFEPWTTTVSYSSLTTLTSTLTDGSKSTSHSYVWVSWLTELTIPPVTTTAIPVWGVSLDINATEGAIILTSSVQPPPFTVTVTPVMSATTTVYGATKTSTSTEAVIIWGEETYYPPTQTETLGESTSTIGGITLPPGVITVTPNPHPTTKPTTTDPVLNSKKHTWTSADTPGPVTTSGCPGCGTTCEWFCDSDCPSCPPGVFSSSSGGGSSDPEDEGDDEDEDEDEDEEFSYITTVYDTLDDGDDALADADMTDDELEVFDDELGDELTLIDDSSFDNDSSTSTTTASTPASTSQTTCVYLPDGGTDYFRVGFGDWSSDDGQSVKVALVECGWDDSISYAEWKWCTEDDGWSGVNFQLEDQTDTASCVEEQIYEATGLTISCSAATGGLQLGVCQLPSS